MLVAEDKHGRQLNVVIQPATARVMIPISIAQKKVRLNLQSENENNDKIYSVTAKQSEIVIYGEKSALAKINKVDLNVDLKKINSSTTKIYRIKLPKGVVKSDPSSVQVQIKVKVSNSSKEN